MLVLGLEGTAHTFGAGIFDSNSMSIIANAKKTFTTQEGGLIPNIVANFHKEVKEEILKEALETAKITIEDIDLITYSESPGLAPCLIVVRDFALKLSTQHKIKLIGVNHIMAHLEIGMLTTKSTNPVFLFCSGANTQIIAHSDGKYRVFGEALSIAIGNAGDKFARNIGLGFPGGPALEKLADKGKNLIELPYCVKGMDLDFSGLVTKATQLYKKGENVEDLAYSFLETSFAMLCEVTERALAHCEKNEVLLIGGVAASKRFQRMLNAMCNDRGATAFTVPLQYAGDQGAMIAYLGWLQKDKEQTKFEIWPRKRVDEINTFWKA